MDDIDFDSGIADVRRVEIFFDRNVVKSSVTMAKRPAVLFQGADGDGEFRFVADGKVDCVDVRVLDSIWR